MQFWIKTMLLTAAVYPLSCFGIGFVLNTIAIFQHSLAAVPFGTMVVRQALPRSDLRSTRLSEHASDRVVMRCPAFVRVC